MNFIKSLGRIIVTALLTAAIIVALLIAHGNSLTTAYYKGVADGRAQTTRTGVLLPNGDTKVIHLENLEAGH